MQGLYGRRLSNVPAAPPIRWSFKVSLGAIMMLFDDHDSDQCDSCVSQA